MGEIGKNATVAFIKSLHHTEPLFSALSDKCDRMQNRNEAFVNRICLSVSQLFESAEFQAPFTYSFKGLFVIGENIKY